MKSEEIFIESYNLPEPLSKEEIYELFSNFNEENRNKIIKHNIRLVLHEIIKKFYNYDYEKKELVSIGILGLINAVDTFDVSKGFEFSSYAARCIDNGILMFIRKDNRTKNDISLEDEIGSSEDNDIRFESVFSDKNDFIEEIEKKEVLIYLRNLINKLNERDKKIIMLYYGFYDDKCYSEDEISNIVKLSQAQVSRIISKIIKIFSIKLQNAGLIELSFKEPIKKEHNRIKEKKPKKSKSIYEIFDNYTVDEVNNMISMLNDNDRKLLTLKYGPDLYNPQNVPMNKKDYRKFYGYLKSKMKRILSELSQAPTTQSYVETENSKEKENNISKKDINKKLDSQIEDKLNEQSDDRPIVELSEKTLEELTYKPSEQSDCITKEYSIKLLKLFKTPTFIDMINILSVKEAIIISLKLGYVDEKYFSNDKIAAFLGIDEEEIRDTIKKIILLYKENLDSLLEETTIQSINTRVLNKNNKES